MIHAVRIASTEDLQIEAKVDLERRLVKIALKGRLDESARLNELWDYLAKLGNDIKTVDFDLGELSRINSAGSRIWLKFVECVQARLACSFSLLSTAVFQQAILLPRILGGRPTEVTAFLAPYICEKCSTPETCKLLTADFREQATFSPPAFTCNNCGGKLVFDDMVAEYEVLLRKMPPKNRRASS
jgi:ABC-type transporter Mla MlaB component